MRPNTEMNNKLIKMVQDDPKEEQQQERVFISRSLLLFTYCHDDKSTSVSSIVVLEHELN